MCMFSTTHQAHESNFWENNRVTHLHHERLKIMRAMQRDRIYITHAFTAIF
jgi:hypothetical protein